jgi:hypothetical protein
MTVTTQQIIKKKKAPQTIPIIELTGNVLHPEIEVTFVLGQSGRLSLSTFG